MTRVHARLAPGSLWLMLTALLAAPSAQAYFDFVPTAAEWAAWPEYCRVQYASIMRERSSDYGEAYTRAAIQHWRDVVGSYTFDSLHHFCSGFHYITRAENERDRQKRDFLLNTALAETLFTYRAAEQDSVVFPIIAINLARIKDSMGDKPGAISTLESTIQTHPDRLELYGALALLHRKDKDLVEAKRVLLRADTVAAGQSAEIQYSLGLVNLELGDVASAVDNARHAYASGYPLPGLRDKLKALGKWPAPEAAAKGDVPEPPGPAP
jgi:tetratricopeptide (TPR) repeat protein